MLPARTEVGDMSDRPWQRIIEEAPRLPPDERLALATELLNNVEGDDDDWDAAWLEELDRRAEEAIKDPSSLEDWTTVKARLLAELRLK
jgi:putative addiction module component (TIGR02574 family)